MKPDFYIRCIPTYQNKIEDIRSKIENLRSRLEALDIPKYRVAAVFDLLILQLQQAIDADDLYNSIEAQYGNNNYVWEEVE